MQRLQGAQAQGFDLVVQRVGLHLDRLGEVVARWLHLAGGQFLLAGDHIEHADHRLVVVEQRAGYRKQSSSGTRAAIAAASLTSRVSGASAYTAAIRALPPSASICQYSKKVPSMP